MNLEYKQSENTPPAFQYAGVVAKDEVHALRALERGEATEYQQRLALQTIVVKLCATHDQTVVLGQPDQTSFRGGRQFVGQAILKFLKLDLHILFGEEKQ